MGKKNLKDLAAFQDYLRTTCNMKPESTSVYACHVRSLLGDLTPDALTSEETLTSYFDSLAQTKTPRFASTRRTAWDRYVEFQESPELAKPKRPVPPPVEVLALPHEVREVLLWLIKEMKFKHEQIPGLNWSLMKQITSSGVCELKNPYCAGEYIRVPAEYVKALRNYAQPQDDTAPLIPKYSGSPFPFPYPGFRKELKAYRAGVVKKHMSAATRVEPAVRGTAVLLLPPESSPTPQGLCAICFQPYRKHAEADHRDDGVLYSCAKEAGRKEGTCAVCEEGCFGRHKFQARKGQ